MFKSQKRRIVRGGIAVLKRMSFRLRRRFASPNKGFAAA
jgi:hypothetical protein